MQTKQDAQQRLAPRRQPAARDDRHGEDDQQQVREDVARRDGQQLRVALAAARARVGRNLPVVGERLALGEVGDQDGEEGGREGDARDAQQEGVALLAGRAGEAVEEFEGDDFEEPEAGFWVGGLGCVWGVVVRHGGRGTYIAGWRMRLTRTRRLATERLESSVSVRGWASSSRTLFVP